MQPFKKITFIKIPNDLFVYLHTVRLHFNEANAEILKKLAVKISVLLLSQSKLNNIKLRNQQITKLEIFNQLCKMKREPHGWARVASVFPRKTQSPKVR